MKMVKVNPYKHAFTSFDRIFNDLFAPVTTTDNGYTHRNPMVNLIGHKDGFRIELAVPGLSKKDIQLNVDKLVLTIEANKETEMKEGEKVLRSGFGFGQFKRTFQLPETIDTEAIKATFKNGILSVELPKKEEAKEKPARAIEIA